MKHNYIRQRQGRDFPAPVPQKDGTEERKSMLTRLEQFKEEAERAGVPVDGHEPTQATEQAAPERGGIVR